MKTCSKCSIEKEVTEFGRDKKRKDGLNPWCSPCVVESSKRYYANNKDAAAERNRRYRQENKEKIAESRKRYRKENPDIHRRNNAKRRALEANAVQGLHYPTYDELEAHYGTRCMVPNCENTDMTIDHIVALENGGDHGLWNFQPLCKSHNSGKQHRNSTDYRTGSIWIESIPVVKPKGQLPKSIPIGDSSRWLPRCDLPPVCGFIVPRTPD